MYLRQSTQVPNKLFDIYLKILSVKELKVLLLVIRQTLGWVDEKGQRKQRDWMSQKFIANKTGLSKKSVSQGIDDLVKKELIIVTDENGNVLFYPSERKGKEKLYFSPSQVLVNFFPKPCVKSTQDPVTEGNITKLTYTKQRAERSQPLRHFEDSYRSLGEVIQKKLGDDF